MGVILPPTTWSISLTSLRAGIFNTWDYATYSSSASTVLTSLQVYVAHIDTHEHIQHIDCGLCLDKWSSIKAISSPLNWLQLYSHNINILYRPTWRAKNVYIMTHHVIINHIISYLLTWKIVVSVWEMWRISWQTIVNVIHTTTRKLIYILVVYHD